ncbi:hypothetical protein ES705_17716 [subsurface metagenome]
MDRWIYHFEYINLDFGSEGQQSIAKKHLDQLGVNGWEAVGIVSFTPPEKHPLKGKNCYCVLMKAKKSKG